MDMMVGAQTLDAAHSARTQARPSPIGNPQIQGNADQHRFEPAELWRARSVEPQLRAKESRHPLVGFGTPVCASEDHVCDLFELRVLDVTRCLRGVLRTQLRQLLSIHTQLVASLTTAHLPGGVLMQIDRAGLSFCPPALPQFLQALCTKISLGPVRWRIFKGAGSGRAWQRSRNLPTFGKVWAIRTAPKRRTEHPAGYCLGFGTRPLGQPKTCSTLS